MSDSKKKIGDEDISILKKMNEKLGELSTLHSQIRLQFLEAEAKILRNRMVVQGEMHKFMEGVAKHHGIPKEELSDWRINLEENIFELISPVATPSEDASTVPPVDPEQQLVSEIKKRWQ